MHTPTDAANLPRRPDADGSVPRGRASRTRRVELIAVIALLLVVGLAHGLNVGNFPYYENDEGTYVSQAWSFLREGQLAPYYYIYDHPPAGWLQIAGWFVLTGGMHTFGTVVESGRAFMVLLQAGSALFVYLIARTLTRRPWIGLLAAAVFSLSAFGIYYQRRVLLDNVATFWALASILLVTAPRPKALRFVLGGAALGVAILSKEVLAAVGPALAIYAITRAEPGTRIRSLIAWVLGAGAVVALYPLYALQRGELFTGATGISLVGTLQQQAARGGDGGLLDPNSGFWGNLRQWAKYEPLLVVAGTAAALLLVVAIRWRPAQAAIGLATLSFWAFLGRGGETISFYVLPLLPLLALDLGLALGLAADGLSRLAPTSGRSGGTSGRLLQSGLIGVATLGAVVGTALGYTSGNPQLHGDPLALWQGTEAVGQREAIQWVLDNVPPDSRIIIDMYMWADLHEVPAGKQPFRDAEYYWKVDLDPTIREGVFKGDWRNVDWVIATPQVLFDAQNQGSLAILKAALAHSRVVTTVGSGWPVEMRKVEASP